MTHSVPDRGLVDLHCHGAMGYDFTDADLAGVTAAVDFHRARGTEAMLLSLVSAPVPRLLERLRALQEIVPATAGALGVHMEGPYLSPARRGAHDPSVLTVPTSADVEAILEAGEGVLRQVTIAPELPGAFAAIDAFTAAGVIVAVGHTEADRDLAARAFDHGARLLTHAFNAMPGLGHREPGPVGAALDRDHVILELVSDGVHVTPVVMRTLFAAAPGRVALVTDAMSATGLGDGDYRLGPLAVTVREGRATLTGTDTIASSTVTMADAVEAAVSAGIPRADAADAASAVPARLLGLA